MDMSPEEKAKYVKAIEKIELADRPEKWRLIKKLVLDMKPWLKIAEAEHSQACKELRQANENKHDSSASMTMRGTLKLFGPVYENIMRLDPEIRVEMSGRNRGTQELIGKQLWDAFPEWRTCREY